MFSYSVGIKYLSNILRRETKFTSHSSILLKSSLLFGLSVRSFEVFVRIFIFGHRESVAYRRGWFGGIQPPPSEIPKALQNRAKLNPIWKLLKIAEFRTPTPQDFRKKDSKILKLPKFAIVLC